MRKLVVSTFMTLDGVMQAPGGPDEDPTGGFAEGGWSVPYWDDTMNEAMGESFGEPFALLLGRRTYEILAASWPQRGSDVPNADWMNSTRKYVASATLEAPEWQNTAVLKGDVGEGVSRLKEEEGETITLNGSTTLLRTLLRAGLVDELRLFLHPIVLGSGHRLFDDGEALGALELAGCRAYDNGVVSLTYRPSER